ncbi:MAG: hypothetical protein M1837_002126 [Sclerophora amabilis]|nr:MAG: hypothetical protein M1837_002126 [Sclerophora amabilis]
MYRIQNLVAREDTDLDQGTLTPAMVNLLIALLVLVLVGLLLVAALFFLRSHRRRSRSAREGLPIYNQRSPNSPTHRRLTVTAAPYGRNSQSVFVCSEKEAFFDQSSPPPSPSTVPEIHITFPEEEDEAGKKKSGRVVVVRVGETGVGLEPYQEQSLPPYQSSDSPPFQSVDLDQIGGLKEKNDDRRWS